MSEIVTIENISYFKYDLLLIFICTFFTYISLRQAKKRFQYKFSFTLGMLASFFSNIALIFMGNSIGVNWLFFIIFLLAYNIFIPFLAVRKAFYGTKND